MLNRAILPQGELLRDFLAQSSISRADLRKIVRRRGLFLRSDEKSETIPALVRTGLTPLEFEFLLRLLTTKEQNPKFSTQTLTGVSTELTLSEAVDQFANITSALDTSFRSYQITNSPHFVTVDGDPNTLELIFEISRTDFSKSFNKLETGFDGRVLVRRSLEGGDVSIITTHTSKETRKICDDVAKEFTSCLKLANLLNSDAESRKIRFSDFSNDSRFNFLYELASSSGGNMLRFQSLTDVGFKPSSQVEMPEGLSWLEESLKSVRFRGDGLEQLKFLKEKINYSHIEVFRFESAFEFTFDKITGECTLTFDFPDFSASGDVNAELFISISSVRFHENDDGKAAETTPTRSVSEKIRSALELDKDRLNVRYARRESPHQSLRATMTENDVGAR